MFIRQTARAHTHDCLLRPGVLREAEPEALASLHNAVVSLAAQPLAGDGKSPNSLWPARIGSRSDSSCGSCAICLSAFATTGHCIAENLTYNLALCLMFAGACSYNPCLHRLCGISRGPCGLRSTNTFASQRCLPQEQIISWRNSIAAAHCDGCCLVPAPQRAVMSSSRSYGRAPWTGAVAPCWGRMPRRCWLRLPSAPASQSTRYPSFALFFPALPNRHHARMSRPVSLPAT